MVMHLALCLRSKSKKKPNRFKKFSPKFTICIEIVFVELTALPPILYQTLHVGY